MDFKIFLNKLVIIFFIVICLGFRVFPGNKKWRLDPNSRSTRKVFITVTSKAQNLENNLPGTDTLNASGSILSTSQLLDSVIGDYNAIQTSNLILARDSDTDFAANGTDKTITIQDGSAAGLSSGEAELKYDGSNIISCKISLTDVAYKNAKTFVHLISHELGHCIGLDHAQDTVNSVMSYFYSEDNYRLAIDDKMGIVHLYPIDSSYADEKPNLGLACSRN